jgi:hypothetical protein
VHYKPLFFLGAVILASCGKVSVPEYVTPSDQIYQSASNWPKGLLDTVEYTCEFSPAGCAAAILAVNLRVAPPAEVATIMQQLAMIAEQASISNPALGTQIMSALGTQAVTAAAINPAVAAVVSATIVATATKVAIASPISAAAMVQVAAATAAATAPNMSAAQRQAVTEQLRTLIATAGGAGNVPAVQSIVASLVFRV